ncbi:MAG: NupC/NupG family nucleoside CNT transporter [Heliobacteriaceae bacterium]|jgi:CNT family concentrative nucleoside transporter|nr:NupC/NupG family nucleoside CNT transporter [Heliobacteriaceae bacterium]
MDRFFGIWGIVLVFGLAFLLSNNRKAVNYKTVGIGFFLQVLLAVCIFRVPPVRFVVMATGRFIQKILEFAMQGAHVVFGQTPYVFALSLIASLIFMMVLVNILYYYGIMQRVVSVLGKAMNRLMAVSGAEALSNAASAFAGQVAAQIMIRPYLAKLTRSELLASMAGSMACVSGATMPIYIAMGVPAQYILASLVMAVPGAFVISKIVYPETNTPETSSDFTITYSKRKRPYTNLFDAISSGASEGIKVAVNVIAMIIALVALVALIDWILGSIGALAGFGELSLTWALGKIFAVFAYFMGVPLNETASVGSLMGTKLVLNEMVAYMNLTSQTLSAKSFLIACFALCNFANFGSVAILLGGVGELAPNQRKNLARLGLRALICGTLTGYMSAAIAGILFK